MNVLSKTRRIAVVALAVGFLGFGSGILAVAGDSAQSSASADSTAAIVNDGSGPQFHSGTVVEVSGDVDGDVYASGQSITISGDVTGDVIAAAQNITVTGSVDGNVRLAAQDVTISGDVAQSGTIMAATVTVADAGTIGRDLVSSAGIVTVNGEVGRDLMLSVSQLTIDGAVGGDVSYYSDREADIAEGGVAGSVERLESAEWTPTTASPSNLILGWILGLLYALVALSAIVVIAGWLFPRRLVRVTDHLMHSPWRALLVGFVAALAVPLLLLVLLITIIGAPLALAGALVWLLLTLATFIYGAYFVGRIVLRGGQRPVLKALVGGLILIVALHIPWLNIVVWFAMVFFGLGAQLLDFYHQRPWRLSSEAENTYSAPAPR